MANESPVWRQSLQGLPFQVGAPEPRPERCFLRCSAADAAVPIPIGRACHTAIDAHAVLDSQLMAGGPLGRPVATYAFRLAGTDPDGAVHEVAIRERFEIAALVRDRAYLGVDDRVGACTNSASPTELLTIRAERAADIAGIRAVNERAFGQPDEAALVDAVRARGERRISLVAVDGERLVGHVLFTPVTIQGPDCVHEAVGLAPMAVDPDHQRRGIGSRLVVQGLDRCRESGYRIAVVLGDPSYYPRFGFVPARLHGIRFELDVPDEVFMVVELEPGVLSGCTGVASYVKEFMTS